MSLLNNLKAENLLACFKDEAGASFAKLCADINSNLGRLEKDIVTKSGQWKTGTKGKIVAKDGHSLQLPLNAPWSSLVLFALKINEISTAGSSVEMKHTMEIQCNFPAVCEAWFTENYRKKVNKDTPKTEVPA